MGTAITWQSTNFNPPQQDTFVFDAFNNLYLFLLAYGTVFPFTPDSSNNPVYSGDLQYSTKFIPVNTPFTLPDPNEFTQQQLDNASMSILNGRLALFSANSTNILNFSTQDPSSFQITTITQALSGGITSQAIATATPLLNNLNVNFSLNEFKNLPSGSQLVASLSNILSNHQQNLLSVSKAQSAIMDFKKKLLRKSVVVSDSIRTVQQKTETFSASGNFNAFAKTFPEMEGFNSLLSNANQTNITKFSNLLPQNLGGGNVSNILTNQLHLNFGSNPNSFGLPNITSAGDKLLSDISVLENSTASFLTNIINQGFNDLEHQVSYLNQSLNILNNIVSKLPTSPTIPIPSAATDVNSINSAYINYYKDSLASTLPSSVPAPAQSTTTKAVNDLYALMKITGPAITNSTPITAANYDPNDSSQGGTLLNTPVFKAIFNGEQDLSIKPPNLNLSFDPSIAAQQTINDIKQLQANQPGIIQTPIYGNSFNAIEDPGSRPRNNPTNGTQGDYALNQKTDI